MVRIVPSPTGLWGTRGPASIFMGLRPRSSSLQGRRPEVQRERGKREIGERERERERERGRAPVVEAAAAANRPAGKMIYRKWSLLTMPAVVLSGLGAVILTQNFVFGANEKFVQKIKQEGEVLRQQDRAKMALEKAA